jgi:hypothetical protein
MGNAKYEGLVLGYEVIIIMKHNITMLVFEKVSKVRLTIVI